MFRPGDRVLLKHEPREARIVISVTPYHYGNLIGCALGGMRESGPAGDYVLAPAGWQDASARPSGGVAYGLSAAAWHDKLDTDNHDPDHQRAVIQWATREIAWAQEWCAQVDPELAAEYRAIAEIDLSRAAIRLAGGDPDAPAPTLQAAE